MLMILIMSYSLFIVFEYHEAFMVMNNVNLIHFIIYLVTFFVCLSIVIFILLSKLKSFSSFITVSIFISMN